jgi:ABC-type Mn2+/Zn2+ transport system permease subunit
MSLILVLALAAAVAFVVTAAGVILVSSLVLMPASTSGEEQRSRPRWIMRRKYSATL